MKRVISFFLLFVSTCAFSQVRMSSAFTDNMVVEQSTTVPIWGTAPSVSRVRIVASWAPQDTLVAVVRANGHWRANIKTPKADMKAHTIKCNDVEIKNVMLGEVWLCGGQSNMEWSVNRGILNGQAEMEAANYPNIRFFQVPLLGADTPQNNLNAAWTQCTPQTMRRVSAVGYFFARALHRELNVPIGIISSAWGGANAEAWVPSEVIDKNANLSTNRVKSEVSWRPIEAGSMYNQMIHPLVPFALSGVIWYQGESNRENAMVYDELMGALIGSWRTKFERQLPFYFVQIAPYDYGQNDLRAAVLREQQEMTSQRVPNTGMVVVMDKVDNVKNIHPKDKTTVGERLASFALAEVYKQPISNYKSPTLDSVYFIDGKSIVSFKNAESGIKINGSKIVGMKIAGDDDVFVDAQAKVLKNNTLQIWSKEVKKPQAVQYCFDDTSIGNVMTVNGLPVAPFRSKIPNEESNGGKKLYAKSYLNEKAPEIVFGNWITPKPEIKGKFVLIDFWATWCGPCKRAIPELNEFQKKFKDDLVVIGLSDEKTDKILSMKEPKIEYSSANDTLARTKKEFQVTGIPHVVLIDPKGVVRWEGFPMLNGFELTEKVLSDLIGKYRGASGN